MNCPACGQVLPADALLCANCGQSLAPSSVRDATPRGRVSRTPTAAARHDPAARPDGERAWRNEVRSRVQDRRRDRGIEVDDELPLFRDQPRAPEPPAPPPRRERVDLPDIESPDPLADVEIQPAEPEVERYAGRTALEEPDVEEDDLVPEEAGWSLGLGDSAPPVSAVERPASAVERVQAAAIDLALLVGFWGLILYFSAKAARVGIVGLVGTWPAVVGYLAGLSLLYAAYFTGITGHTPGKMMVGLRVVDTYGRAPGFVRALFRAIVGTIGTAAAFVAMLPMIFDPARRALHDRLFGTRVIRR